MIRYSCISQEERTELWIQLQLSLIENVPAIRPFIASQAAQSCPRTLIDGLLNNAITTQSILKAHLTANAQHINGHLVVPLSGLEGGYRIQAQEVISCFAHANVANSEQSRI